MNYPPTDNPYELYGYTPNPAHQAPPPNPGDYFPALLPSPLSQRMHKLAYPGESASFQHNNDCPCQICQAARQIPTMSSAERAQQRALAAQSPYYWRNWKSASAEHAPHCACEDCHGNCRLGPKSCKRCAFKASFVHPDANTNANANANNAQAPAPAAPVPNRYNLRPRRP
ncbi:hypothetical protein C8F01DRAFT_1137976 [Mycena amicta]|nr:hypothetical protein C8F01DRAFT_1137976 [Mycena amicta]